jgi:hypothetical protein
VNVLEELEGNEVMADLPEEIRREDDDGDEGAEPEPRRTEKAPRWSEEDSGNDAEDEEPHRVLREHSESDEKPYREPPASVVGAKKTNDAVRDDDPPEMIEGDILKEHPG